MTPFDLLLMLGVKTLILSLAALVASLVLRLTRCRSPKIHHLTWAAVLLLGVLGAGIPLSLPVAENRPVVVDVVAQATSFASVPAQPADGRIPDGMRKEKGEDALSTERCNPTDCTEDRSDSNGVRSDYSGVRSGWEDTHSSTHPVGMHRSVETALQQTASHSVGMRPTIETTEILAETISPFQFYATLICTAWCIGIVVILCWRLAAFLMLMRALRSATPVEGLFSKEWRHLLTEYNIPPERLPLLLTDQIGPGLVWRRQGAAVLVPRDLWEEATPEIRDGILRHELTHYRNRDLLRSGISQLLAVVHWFNPVSWFVLHKLDEATEWLCDLAAFGTTDNGRHLFAESLVAVHETNASISLGRYGFGSGSLERRISQLQSSLDNQGDSKMKKASIVFILALFITAGLFQVRFVPVAADSSSQNGEGLTGTVLLPDGEPAKDAVGGVATFGLSIQVKNGTMNTTFFNNRFFKADADGKFVIPKDALPTNQSPRFQDYKVIFMHDEGTACLTKEEFENHTGPITLQPRSRIEGTVFVGNKPGKNLPVMSDLVSNQGFGRPGISQFNETMSDENGHYVFERVLPGTGGIGRSAKSIVDEMTTWTPFHVKEYDIKPGKTLHIDLGGGGYIVKGRIMRIGELAAKKADLRYARVTARPHLSDYMALPAGMKQLFTELMTRDVDVWASEEWLSMDYKTADEREQKLFSLPVIQQKMAENPGLYDEAIEYSKLESRNTNSGYNILRIISPVDEKGNFQLDDLTPGQWTLDIELEIPPPPYKPGDVVRSSEYWKREVNITVPDLPGGPSDEPLELTLFSIGRDADKVQFSPR